MQTSTGRKWGNLVVLVVIVATIVGVAMAYKAGGGPGIVGVWAVAWLLCGAIGAAVGKDRKMGQGGGFALGFLLGPLGVIIVAVSDKPSVLTRVQAQGQGPDWYPDPLGRFDSRWWDGQRWTQHVGRVATDGGHQQFEDPL